MRAETALVRACPSGWRVMLLAMIPRIRMRAFLRGSRAVALMCNTGLSRPLEKRLSASRSIGGDGGNGCVYLVRGLTAGRGLARLGLGAVAGFVGMGLASVGTGAGFVGLGVLVVRQQALGWF